MRFTRLVQPNAAGVVRVRDRGAALQARAVALHQAVWPELWPAIAEAEKTPIRVVHTPGRQRPVRRMFEGFGEATRGRECIGLRSPHAEPPPPPPRPQTLSFAAMKAERAAKAERG